MNTLPIGYRLDCQQPNFCSPSLGSERSLGQPLAVQSWSRLQLLLNAGCLEVVLT